MKQQFLDIVDGFGAQKVLVVGDVIADVYTIGTTSRISREAPVLILEFDSERVFLGGAGNAAANTRAYGAEVMIAGAIGDDQAGRTVIDLLSESGIDAEGLLRTGSAATAIKTRILAGGRHTSRQQVVRLDRCPRTSLDESEQQDLLVRIGRKAQEADAIIISDYGYGLVTEEVFKALRQTAARRGIPITVDTRYDLLRYSGVTAQTPNETEIEEVLDIPLQTDEKRFRSTAEKLRRELALEALLVTRGSRGMMLTDESGTTDIPVFGTDEVADVTGAGDTVIATFTLAISTGADYLVSANLANIAGGLVVMKRGTGTVSANELRATTERLGD